MRIAPRSLMTAMAMLFAVAGSVQAEDGALVFQVDHVRDDKGHVRVDVCTEDNFLKDGCPFSGEAPAAKGMVTVTVPNVPPGVYAAQVYHDRNDDHRVNRSHPLGIPLEEVGFSNNAAVGLSGPKWKGAAFTHDGGDQQLDVRLKHYP